MKETKRQGRIAHHLHRFCPMAMTPFFASKATKGRAPHIVALLGFTFYGAKVLYICKIGKNLAGLFANIVEISYLCSQM